MITCSSGANLIDLLKSLSGRTLRNYYYFAYRAYNYILVKISRYEYLELGNNTH